MTNGRFILPDERVAQIELYLSRVPLGKAPSGAVLSRSFADSLNDRQDFMKLLGTETAVELINFVGEA
jgi:hypothetical protein